MKILYLDMYLYSFAALISKNYFLTCVITHFDSHLKKIQTIRFHVEVT